MAAELIATSPELGAGLGQFLHNGMSLSDISMVFAGILLIFVVGVGSNCWCSGRWRTRSCGPAD
jgi:NitT/TauT family transport system permease protein